MLRADIDQPKGFIEWSIRSLRPLAVILLAVLFAGPAYLRAQNPSQPQPPSQPLTANATQSKQTPQRVAINASRRQKPFPAPISAMPGVQEELEVIQHRSQLVVGRDNIVRTAVADSSLIDVVQYSPNEISIIGVQLGATTLTIWFENNPTPLIYLVRTIRDPSIDQQKRIDYGKLERKLAVLFPNSKVYLIPLSRKIVVKGQAQDAEEAAHILQIVRGEVINQEGAIGGPQPSATTNAGAPGLNPLDLASGYIVNMLEVPGENQVMLRVRIAELSRSQLRRSGIDFNLLINDGRHAIGYSLGGLPTSISGIFEAGEINFLVNLLASNGTAKILAEPVLTVISGHSASFLSGGEFAVPTIVGVDGVAGQQTTFRGFGTSLVVTPVILDKDLIKLQITPEFSQINLGNSVNGIPGVDSRRVTTTVKLREGQTIVIAGLVSHEMSTEVTRIPFLGAIPFIGPRFFSAKVATQDETELLILVTPEIARPMDADEVPPVPGHEVTHPSDWELYHAAMTEGAPNTGYFQLAPYGRGGGPGIDVGYRLFEPAPASPLYSPVPTAPYGSGYPHGSGFPQPGANAYPQYGPQNATQYAPQNPQQLQQPLHAPNYQNTQPQFPNFPQPQSLPPVPSPTNPGTRSTIQFVPQVTPWQRPSSDSRPSWKQRLFRRGGSKNVTPSDDTLPPEFETQGSSF